MPGNLSVVDLQVGTRRHTYSTRVIKQAWHSSTQEVMKCFNNESARCCSTRPIPKHWKRSVADRFHRDSSLDRATHLREAQRRRAGYLADLKKRDQEQQRGRRYVYRTNVDGVDNASEHSDASLLGLGDAAAGAKQQHREIYAGSSQAAAAEPQRSPRFNDSQTRPPCPTRPSTTPGTAATGRAKSPSRLGGGSCPKENRQAATARAVRVYSAGAGVPNGGHRRRSPVTSLPAWDDRSPSPSVAEQQRRRLSPREHGRHPVPWSSDDVGVGKAGKVRC